jgi:hypothetical protein
VPAIEVVPSSSSASYYGAFFTVVRDQPQVFDDDD